MSLLLPLLYCFFNIGKLLDVVIKSYYLGTRVQLSMPKALGSIFSKTTKKAMYKACITFWKTFINESWMKLFKVMRGYFKGTEGILLFVFVCFLTLAVNHLGKQDGFSSSSIHWFTLLWLWKWIQPRLEETGRYFVLEGIWFHKRMKYVSSLLCDAKNAFHKIKWNKPLI